MNTSFLLVIIKGALLVAGDQHILKSKRGGRDVGVVVKQVQSGLVEGNITVWVCHTNDGLLSHSPVYVRPDLLPTQTYVTLYTTSPDFLLRSSHYYHGH